MNARYSFLALALTIASAGCSTPVRRGPPVFIPPPPVEPRLQVLMTFSSAADLGAKQSKLSIAILGKKTKPGIRFNKPYAAVPRGQKLYVTDTGAHTVWVVDLATRSIKRLPGDAGMGKLKVPVNMAFDDLGSLYVADTRRHEIVVYDKDGRYVRKIGDPKTLTPAGIAVRGDKLIVSDIKRHVILTLNKTTGATLSSFGGPGRQPGKTSFPSNIALDGAGNIYVAEAVTARVEKFTPDGELLGVFGRLGKRMGELVRPRGIAVDHAGRLWVCDAATSHVQIFDAQKRLLLFFGGNPQKPGGLFLPAGIAVTRDPQMLATLQPHVADGFEMEAAVFVVSQFGSRMITVYALGRKKKPS